jgi:hypothetical protein
MEIIPCDDRLRSFLKASPIAKLLAKVNRRSQVFDSRRVQGDRPFVGESSLIQVPRLLVSYPQIEE